MNYEYNTVEVVQKMIRYYKLPVTDESIRQNILSHPDYPSLKSICDNLKKWKIKTYPVRISPAELKETETPFIAYLKNGKGKFVFVPKLGRNLKVKYYDSLYHSTLINKVEFFNQYSGISLFIDPNEFSYEPDFKVKRQNQWLRRALLYSAILSFILYCTYPLFNHAKEIVFLFPIVALVLTNFLGLCLSVILFLNNVPVNSKLIDALCNVSSNKKCNSKLNIKASRLFGWIHWNEVGLVYFLSGFLFFIDFPSNYGFGLFATLSVTSLGFVGFSLYYQGVVLKSWCFLCIAVQFVLLIEALQFVLLWRELSFTWQASIKYFLIASIVSILVILLKDYIIKRFELNDTKINLQRFKKNPIVFHRLLLQDRKRNVTVGQKSFIIGRKEAPLVVSAFLSLECNRCISVFNELMTIFGNKEIKINLILMATENRQHLLPLLGYLFFSNKQKDAVQLLSRWYNGSASIRKKIRKLSIGIEDKQEIIELIQYHQDRYVEAKVRITPTILINGYRIPKGYQLYDMTGFVEEFKGQPIY